MYQTTLIRALIFFVVALPICAAAQQVKPSQMKVIVSPVAADIPVLKAADPTARKPRRIKRNTGIPVLEKLDDANRPAPLAAGQYKLLTTTSQPSKPTGGTGIQANPEPVLEHLQLTPRNSIKGLGHLTFNRVFNFNPQANQAIFYLDEPSPLACIFATVEVEAGERYLVDFSVSVEDETEFTISIDGDSQKMTVDDGSHHLLAYLDAAGDGDVTMVIFSDTAKYTFYALDITKLN
jgi:hypothetical protein